MQEQLNALSALLDKANQKGAFTLQESAIAVNALGAVVQFIQQHTPSSDPQTPTQAARAEAKERNLKKVEEELQANDPSQLKMDFDGEAE